MTEKYNKDISLEVLVGFFMFIILIALGVFTIVLSRQNFLQKKYPLMVAFPNVGGLRDGDHVFLRGMKVGTVKSTRLENDHVIVTASLDVPVTLYPGYKVEIIDASLLGGKLMKISEGDRNAPALPDDLPVRGQKPIEILDEFGAVISSLRTMADELAAGEGTLGKLLNDDEVYSNLQKITADLRDISGRLNAGEGTLGKLIGSDEVYNNLQKISADLRDISTRLNAGEGTLGRLLSADGQLYEDLQASAGHIRRITGQLESGGGTLGKLMQDDQIYVEAQKLLQELRAAVDDMRETSPVTTFSSVFFGAF